MVELKKATVFDYVRFVGSSLILVYSLAITCYAIIERKTMFWDAVPGWAALILFIVDLFILGVVEGLQIALVELKRQHPYAYKNSHPKAYVLGQLAAKGDNVECFLMGRQVFVVLLVFFAAKLTTIYIEDGESFLHPVPYWFGAVFLETGILSCMVIVIMAQLMPQIVAAKYPVHFLEFLIMRPAYYICIFVEMTGLTHACWLLSAGLGRATGMTEEVFKMEGVEAKISNQVIAELEADLHSTGECGSSDNDLEKLQCMNGPQDNLKPPNPFSRYSILVDELNTQVNAETLKVLQCYLNNHPQKFHQFPSVIGSKIYPSPKDLADQYINDGKEVPRFLTDISSPDHIPPHIVACELLARNVQLQEELNLLNHKLNSLC